MENCQSGLMGWLTKLVSVKAPQVRVLYFPTTYIIVCNVSLEQKVSKASEAL